MTASNYEQDQEIEAAVRYSVIMYVNYDLTVEDGRDGRSYKQEQKIAAINSTENYAQASTHVNNKLCTFLKNSLQTVPLTLGIFYELTNEIFTAVTMKITNAHNISL